MATVYTWTRPGFFHVMSSSQIPHAGSPPRSRHPGVAGYGGTSSTAADPRTGHALTRAFAAERVGFEPTVSFPTHDFQSCRFGRSRTPPGASEAIVGTGPVAPCDGRALRNGIP